MEWYEKTDIGCVRKTNQDVCKTICRPDAHTAILVVCDGMGGANAGNIASEVACQQFTSELEQLEDMGNRETREMCMQSALSRANAEVYQMSKEDTRLSGMGTTLVSACVKDGEASILNVGDSRAYVLRDGVLTQISEDHSYVEQLVREGRITREMAREHPQRNLITRAVGVDDSVQGDLFSITLSPSDVLLLCSDGLSGMLTDDKMQEILLASKTLSDAGEYLMAAAKEAGGRDNITIVLWKDQIQETEGGA